MYWRSDMFNYSIDWFIELMGYEVIDLYILWLFQDGSEWALKTYFLRTVSNAVYCLSERRHCPCFWGPVRGRKNMLDKVCRQIGMAWRTSESISYSMNYCIYPTRSPRLVHWIWSSMSERRKIMLCKMYIIAAGRMLGRPIAGYEEEVVVIALFREHFPRKLVTTRLLQRPHRLCLEDKDSSGFFLFAAGQLADVR